MIHQIARQVVEQRRVRRRLAPDAQVGGRADQRFADPASRDLLRLEGGPQFVLGDDLRFEKDLTDGSFFDKPVHCITSGFLQMAVPRKCNRKRIE